jgi:type II secretory pathway component GspD/PulD (secretin)
MKIFLFLVISFSCFAFLSAQVPAQVEEISPVAPAQTTSQTNNLLSAGLFSDPSEIEIIEGLDEPLERVKLRDQDSNMILDMIQAITGRYILRPQNLPQVKINFDSMNILTKRETLLALESLLAMNGVGITKIDSQFFKAVPATGINAHVPIWIDVPANSLAPSQRIYTKMFPLQYVPAEKMREILNPFATPNVSSLLTFSNANSILITDSLTNLQRIEKIIKSTDEANENSQFKLQWYEPVRFPAEVLKSEFEQKYEDFFKTSFHLKPSFIVPESNDQLGIYSHPLDSLKVFSIIKEMDVEVLNPIVSDLKHLYHASAESVAKTLGEFLQSTSKDKSSIPTPSIPTPSRSSSNPGAKASSGKTGGGTGVAEEFSYSPYAKVVADKRSNGIFMTGTASDLKRFAEHINLLDTPLPMAQIDTIFVMIDLSTSNMRGIDALFRDLHWSDTETQKTRKVEVPNYRTETVIDPVTGQVAIDPITLEPVTREIEDGTREEEVNYLVPADTLSGGLTIPGLNSNVEFELENWELKKIKWGQIFAAASERNDVRIFSTPSITVIHGGGEEGEKGGGQKSKIQIKDIRSVGHGYRSVAGSDNTGEYPDRDSGRISDREAITELVIQNPRIRKSTYLEVNGTTVVDENNKPIVDQRGTIFMSVEVTAEKFDETHTNVYDGQEMPSIKSRYAQTNLAIRDGEIMVLGGLQEVQLDTTVSKYNILSDIPYFGEKFFTPRSQKYTPTELLIFIRPRIIDPENLDQEMTELNSQRLDQLMEPNYNPVFISPSKKILGVSKFLNEKSTKDKSTKPDERSKKPSF